MSTLFRELDSLFNHALRYGAQDFTLPRFPHLNWIKVNDQELHLELALAGYSKDELSVNVTKNSVEISGNPEKTEKVYLHRGISRSSFKLSYPISDHFRLNEDKVVFENGILRLVFEKHIPEELKPRTLSIR